MVLPNKLAVLAGAVLAVAIAVVTYLHLQSPWTAILSAIILAAGVFGVQALKPAAIAAKIPAHVAAILSAALVALQGLNISLTMSTLAHAIIGVVFVIAATLGITVTGVAVSLAARRPAPAAK